MENKKRICPICGSEYTEYPSISRRDNKTEICPACGIREALEDFAENEIKRLTTEERGALIFRALDGANLAEISAFVCAMIEMMGQIMQEPATKIAEEICDMIREVNSELEV